MSWKNFLASRPPYVFPNDSFLWYAHYAQTKSGFPIASRPVVIRLFLKNAHNYDKNYGINVHTLGCQITEWWAELSPPSGAPSIRFGGPTGVYTLVVLLSWWCLMVKVKPVGEHADCLRTLADVNRVLLTEIEKMKNHPAASTSTLLSPTSPSPSQSRKRGNTEELSPRKRTRSGRA